MLNIQVKRMYRFEEGRILRAYVDICVNDVLLIKGLKVLTGSNGLFVSMPQEKGKDERWYDSVKCLNSEIKDQISRVVLACYTETDCESNCLTTIAPPREVPDSFNQWLVEKRNRN